MTQSQSQLPGLCGIENLEYFIVLLDDWLGFTSLPSFAFATRQKAVDQNCRANVSCVVERIESCRLASGPALPLEVAVIMHRRFR
ncbi:hypothetical protein [Bradyrhizobium brasilense]|uniref:Uncharacterized protein n=1 Tax=Bradyrhizobium brasilense TaxID=1419277 RepID=A0ABY8JB67_9BRAD|nr:hypothetical protein [Bradyrhizobium brasilense]WFU62736.1 hypothetical protein QA636_35715 [Bradyrhizobium brasilense]